MSELADRARKKWKINQYGRHDVDIFGRKLLEKLGLKCDKATPPPEPHNTNSRYCESEGVDLDETEDKMQPKTKQKKVKFEDRKENVEVSDCDFVQLPKKKKKSSRATVEEITMAEALRTDDVLGIDGNISPRKEKKNKKRSHAETFVSYVEDEAKQRDHGDGEIHDVITKKKKKRKIMSPDGDSCIAEVNIVTVQDPKKQTNEAQPFDCVVAETKKKKKTKPDLLGLSNVAFDPSMRESRRNGFYEVENPYEVKPKKEKHNFAIINPTFDCVDEKASDTTGEGFEVKRKKKKSKKDKERRGLDNPALSDESGDKNESIVDVSSMCMPNVDLMLNVVTLPLSAPKVNSEAKKRVRFSDVNKEIVIPSSYDDNFSFEEASNRNELFDVNEAVIARSLHGFVNNAFDIASNKVSFYDSGLETKARRNIGVDNVAFAPRQCSLNENIESIYNTIDRYHAEVENDMNEAKTNRRLRKDEVAVASNVYKRACEEELLLEQMRTRRSEDSTPNANGHLNPFIQGQMQPRSLSNEDMTRANPNRFTRCQFEATRRSFRMDRTVSRARGNTEEISVVAKAKSEVMVGEVGTLAENHESVDEGTKLSYKLAAFEPVPAWYNRKEGNYAKKSYKHLIRGDVILAFKNTNLHEIKGYANKKRRRPAEFV